MQVLVACVSMFVVAVVCFGAIELVLTTSKLGLEGWLYMHSARLNAAGDAVVEYKRTVAIYRGEVIKLVEMRAKQREAIVESGL